MSENQIVWRRIARDTASLLKYIVGHSESFKRNSKNDERTSAIISIIHRIMRNLRGVYILATESGAHADSVFLKLPVGLLLRNCLMDGLLALHIAQNDNQGCKNLMSLSNWTYLRALFEEFEVYRDKQSAPLDDATMEHIYTMAIEDTYLSELAAKAEVDQLQPLNERQMWKARDLKEIYEGCKKSDIAISNIKYLLSKKEKSGECAKNLYAYYKYFSQYEHYSPRGNGDSLADFGDDNIRFEKTFAHLEECLRLLVASVVKDDSNNI